MDASKPSFDKFSSTSVHRRTNAIVWIIPLVLLLVLVGLSGLVWRLERIDEWAVMQSDTSNFAVQVARRIDLALANVLRPIRRTWYNGRFDTPEDFEFYARPLVFFSSTTTFAAWVDGNGVCRQVVGGPGRELLGKNLRTQSEWADLFARAQSNPLGAAGPVSLVRGVGPVVNCAFASAQVGSQAASGGTVIFQIKLIALLNSLGDPRAAGEFALQISDGDTAFYRMPGDRAANPIQADFSNSVGQPITFLDRTWVIRAAPTPAFLDQRRAQTPEWAVLLWLSGSAVLVVGICLAIAHQRASDRKQTEYLQALEKIAEVSTGILSKVGSGSEVWQQLVEAARSLTSMSKAAVVVLEDGNTTLRFVATAGVTHSMVGVKMCLADMRSAQQCVETKTPVACSDLKVASGFANNPLAEKYGVRSFIQVPLLVDEEIIGIMMLASSEPHQFSPAEMRLAELWGGLAAVIAANEKLYEQTNLALNSRNRLLQQRDALFALHDVILGPESTDQILQKIADLAPAPIGVELCVVELLDEQGKEMMIAAVTEHFAPHLKGYRFPLAGSVAEQVILSREVRIFEDTSKDTTLHPFLKTQVPCGSILFQPLLGTDGKPMGYLTLLRKDPGPITKEQLSLAQIFASRAAAAIEIAELYEKTTQALSARDRLLLQLDSLLAVHESIGRTESSQEILQRIADLAPAPAGVEVCMVIVQSETAGELRVAAMTSNFAPHLNGYRYQAEGSNSGRVIRERRTHVIEDGPNDSTIHPYLRTQVPCGSMIYQPLVGTDNKAMGLLVLLRKDPGKFSAEQVNLAQVFAARATAAIEIAQLHEQTRRDADAKATLLRELNHRVKNNLSGIVTLLTLHQPELPSRARQWLDRAVDRIRTLARTHDALSGGLQHASLQELIDQALGALAVVTRPGVTVRVETQPGVFLRNKRAVSVAMVLHELCYNALVHGLSDTGLLQVRSTVQATGSSPAGKSLLIEVIDDGCGFSDASLVEGNAATDSGWEARNVRGATTVAPARVVPVPLENLSAIKDAGTGLGLNLVNDFVARELRGRFTIISRPGEGTTARLEFPLLEDEMAAVV